MTLRDAFEGYLAERADQANADAEARREEAERQAAVAASGADALGELLDRLPEPEPTTTDPDLMTNDALMAAIEKDTQR